MNYTSIEQSNKLLELGLPRDTADMVYEYNFLSESNDTTPKAVNSNLHDTTLRNIPCWSIGALFGLLRSYNDCNSLSVFSNRSQKWQITISYYDVIWKEHKEISINLLEASYGTVVWLLENGYIKIEKK